MPGIVIIDDKVQFDIPAGKRLHLPADFETDGVIRLSHQGGAMAANALLMGYGTSANPATTDEADKDFIEMRTQSSATSGSSRGLYWRHNLSGAGQDGECIRAFTDLTAAVGTARGSHVSLQAGATGYVTGLGAGQDAQLYLKNEVLHANGTYSALNAEIYSEGATTDPSGATIMSFLRAVLGGHATGIGRVDDKANLIVVTGGANGSGNMVGAAGNEPTWTSATYLIRCNLNGTSIGLVGVAL